MVELMSTMQEVTAELTAIEMPLFKMGEMYRRHSVEKVLRLAVEVQPKATALLLKAATLLAIVEEVQKSAAEDEASSALAMQALWKAQDAMLKVGKADAGVAQKKYPTMSCYEAWKEPSQAIARVKAKARLARAVVRQGVE